MSILTCVELFHTSIIILTLPPLKSKWKPSFRRYLSIIGACVVFITTRIDDF